MTPTATTSNPFSSIKAPSVDPAPKDLPEVTGTRADASIFDFGSNDSSNDNGIMA